MPKIKIFVDCHVFDSGFQGTTTYIKGLYTELVNDVDKEFYFAANNPETIKAVFGENDNIHYLKYSSKNKFYRLLFDIPSLIKKNKIDFAHFQYIVPPVKKCKYINTIHDILFLDYPELFPLSYRLRNGFLFRLSAKLSDYVLTVSDYSKKSIAKHYRNNNVIVTPNAVDAEFYKAYNKQEAIHEAKQLFNIDNYWLYVSRWEPRKNHHTLLEVFVKYEHYKKYQLVFVGDKALYNAEFEELYKSLNQEIKSRVILLEKVNFKNLLVIMRGAKLFVYPSIAEGFGIPPLEAAAAGIPVACSGSSAMSDFDFLGEGLFDPLSLQDMDRAIKAMLKPDVQNVKDRLAERYNWQKSADVMRKIFSSNV